MQVLRLGALAQPTLDHMGAILPDSVLGKTSALSASCETLARALIEYIMAVQGSPSKWPCRSPVSLLRRQLSVPRSVGKRLGREPPP